MSWKVEWEDEGFEGCDTPLEAALQAAESIAMGECMCFTVTNYKTDERYSVDLNEAEGEEVLEIGE
jgi:hypothetical protein